MTHQTSLWEYRPATDYVAPSPPISEAVQGRVVGIWRRVRAVLGAEVRSENDDEVTLSCPTDDVLQVVTPALNWQQAAQALAAALGDWHTGAAMGGRIRTVIGPPGSGVADVVHAFAVQYQLPVLEAPEPEDILTLSTSNHACMQRLREAHGSAMVIPRLERFYLRHHAGLALVRELLLQCQADARRIVLGCDSWAWAYLCTAVHLEGMTGQPLALAPFDGEQLNHWLHTEANGREQAFSFRQLGNDEPVFVHNAPEPSPSGDHDDSRQMSPVIQSLAAASRGIPAVAQALWQHSLRTLESCNAKDRHETDDNGPTLWVVPASSLPSSPMPTPIELLHQFVLHAILLHGGLTLPTLLTVLPMRPDHVIQCVSALKAAGVVDTVDDHLRVVPLAYTQVRQHLADEAFLVDAF